MNGFRTLFGFKDTNLLKRFVSITEILGIKQVLLF